MQPDTTQALVHVAAQSWKWALAFFAIGHFGFIIRIFFVLRRSGQRKLSVVDDYIADNSLVVAFGVVCYWALIALWLWSDVLSLLGPVGAFFGLVPHVLNPWTIGLAFFSDVALLKLLDIFGEKAGLNDLSMKMGQVIPKLSAGSSETPPTTPPTA